MGRAGSPLHAAALISNGAHRSDAPYRAIYCSRERGAPFRLAFSASPLEEGERTEVMGL
jgi:hypothetical protein